jgi:hypothetical protein
MLGCIRTYHIVKWWIRDDSFFKSAFLRDIRNNGKGELVFANTLIRFCDLVGFLLGSNGGYDGMSENRYQ